MNIFRDFDEIVLDCLFQPLADLVARFVSCFEIADRLFWTTFGLLVVTDVCQLRSAWIAVTTHETPSSIELSGIACIAVTMLLPMVCLDHLKLLWIRRVHREGTDNPLRLYYVKRLGQMIMWVFLMIANQQDNVSDFGMIVYALAAFVWMLALYFSACRVNPPALMQHA
jgi:hypothetical protein